MVRCAKISKVILSHLIIFSDGFLAQEQQNIYAMYTLLHFSGANSVLKYVLVMGSLIYMLRIWLAGFCRVTFIVMHYSVISLFDNASSAGQKIVCHLM